MKKLIIAIAIMGSVAVANASSVSWGASTALDTDKVTAGIMYLVGATDSATIDLTKFDNQTSFSYDTITAAGFDRLYSSFEYSSSKTSVTADKFNASDLGYSAGSVSVYTILVETGASADYIAYAGPKNMSLNNATSPTANLKFTAASFTYVQAAPEPTSGLMLLLGFAGLALKRKRA